MNERKEWGAGLPTPGSGRPDGPGRKVFRVLWTIFWSLWLITWIFLGWMTGLFWPLGILVGIGALLAFSRPAHR
jgi:hypothetical protein